MYYKKITYLSENYPDPDPENLALKRDYIIPQYPTSAIYIEPSFDYVMIKTSEKMKSERGGSLYESTKRFWRAGEKISDYTYVVSVVNQIVQRVYIADTWFKFSDGGWENRWGFFGREAKGEEFDKLIGKRIPEKYRVPGNANPVLYKKWFADAAEFLEKILYLGDNNYGNTWFFF